MMKEMRIVTMEPLPHKGKSTMIKRDLRLIIGC